MAKFEDRLTALEAVVERLERGDLTLDDSVRLFEEGVKLSDTCKAELDKAEGRVQMLIETRGGEMETSDLDVKDLVDDEADDTEDDQDEE